MLLNNEKTNDVYYVSANSTCSRRRAIVYSGRPPAADVCSLSVSPLTSISRDAISIELL